MSTRKHKMLESSHWICVISLLLWLLVFSLQSHKEERFMYPIYPLICASAAFTIKLIEQFVVGTKRPYSSPFFKVIVCICFLAFLGLSLSRVFSLYHGKLNSKTTNRLYACFSQFELTSLYCSPPTIGFKPTFAVFSDLKKFDKDDFEPLLKSTYTSEQNTSILVDKYINVCYGKEWYRYPSSFFLPSSTRYRMRFIKSEFRGQLPKLYDNDDKLGLKTHIVYNDFNDVNKEEVSRYIEPEQCHYLIDSSQPTTSGREPDYSKDAKNWKVMSSHKMLDLNNSPVIIRSFYLPFLSEKQNSYVEYKLLRNNNLFILKQDNKQS